MFHNHVATLTSVPLALVLAIITNTPLQAAPHSYCFRGECHHFHGEAHLIEALSHMDHAASAHCNVDRIRESAFAKQDVMAAYREICDPAARRELISASVDLSRYIGTRDVCYLDHAWEHIHRALELEQLVHARPAAHIHHQRGHRAAPPAGPSFRPNHSPYSTYIRTQAPRQHPSQGYIRFGSPSFSIGFHF